MKKVKKYKLSRRLGVPIFEKCQTQKFALRERRKDTRQKSISDYGRQLIEKQKVRFLFGLTERQLRKYVEKALSNEKLSNEEALTEYLERRLDNVVYRLGIADTRRQARQMVSHGHTTVNGKKVTIPSIHIRDKDVISVREGSKKTKLLSNISSKKSTVPWAKFDSSKLEGKVIGKPQLDEIINLSIVFEYYSR